MSDISITFTASSYSELLQQVDAFGHELRTFGKGQPTPATPIAVPATGHDGYTEAPTPAPAKTAEPKEDKPTYTVEEIRAEAVKLPTEKMREILNSIGAPKLSSVPEEKYPELMAAIKEAL